MKIELFDTTLRDGTQGEGINLSVIDKLRITQLLDEFGIDLIEGGWPGSNPKDEEYFKRVRDLDLKQAQVCCFGSTARKTDEVSADHNLNTLLQAETEVVTIFGKTWRAHSRVGLGLEDGENETLIGESVRFLKEHGRRVIFDAEHFFDGYKDDPDFALTMIKAAASARADLVVLCDTNGGCLPVEIRTIVQAVGRDLSVPLGIHAHNDGDLAVANTVAAVEAGTVQVQGTINGIGERCGNANLCSVIPVLMLKMGHQTNNQLELARLSELSRTTAEIMNLAPNHRAPFVGKSAFAHKGGIHVSAVLKDASLYEHIEPDVVGGQRRVLISDLSGKSNILYKTKELGIDLDRNGADHLRNLVQRIKKLEFEGYQFDGAEASFELLLREELGEFTPFFDVIQSSVHVRFGSDQEAWTEAVMRVQVDGESEHTAANGVGPVNALDVALRKALIRFYPELATVKLVDYKVRVLDEKQGTSAKVRVLVETSDGHNTWSTVGVSENIIEASWHALRDSINYKLFKSKTQAAGVPD